MFKRIREFFESIAYAGLRPSGGKPQDSAKIERSGWTAPIRKKIDALLDREGESDPLYLSNRTFLQKARIWLIVGIPSVLLLGGLGLVLGGTFDQKDTFVAPPKGLSNAEIARRMLPDLSKDLNVGSQHDLEVEDVQVIHGGPVQLAGVALNKTDHMIRKADLVFELTDGEGSRQGAVSTQLVNLAAKSRVPFIFTIQQKAAAFALVREIHIE